MAASSAAAVSRLRPATLRDHGRRMKNWKDKDRRNGALTLRGAAFLNAR
jgi:hypothetical protein